MVNKSEWHFIESVYEIIRTNFQKFVKTVNENE